MSLVAILLAWALLRHGAIVAEPLAQFDWLFSGDAETARDLLSTLLSGLITMTSLIVSLTFVSLTLAANQLGPRLIWHFIGDRQIQAAIGFFLSTIFYVLIVLRSISGELGAVEHVAVSFGSGLTGLCLFVLLFYVHKIARAVIADNVVEKVASDLNAAVEAMLPNGRERAAPSPPAALPPVRQVVALAKAGYVQTVDYEGLVDLARQADGVLRVGPRAGHFVLAEGAHVELLGDKAVADPERLADDVRGCFVIGSQRSPAQDLEHAIRQLVEIGLRALSPGINDPFTAIAVIDRLGAALARALARPAPPGELRDGEGAVRVLPHPPDADGLVSAAFDQIRQAAGQQPAVLIRLADMLALMAGGTIGRDARAALAHQLALLGQTAELVQMTEGDRAAVLDRVGAARVAALRQAGARPAA